MECFIDCGADAGGFSAASYFLNNYYWPPKIRFRKNAFDF
jgi:hypothetical protein